MGNSAAVVPNDEGFKDFHEVAAFPDAEALVGVTIAKRWELVELLAKSPQDSGGVFGVGYRAHDLKDGVDRFVKVVDYRRKLEDPIRLVELLQEARFEVAAHKACLRMTKVVRMVDHGMLTFRKTDDDALYSFLCLVQELGDGDIKTHVDYMPNQGVPWKLWVLRDVALAARQMENANLAHNDIKPSNVIRFENKDVRRPVKLGDVGRIVTKSGSGPHDEKQWAGDPRHKPIEVLYGWYEPEWTNRSTAADAYMLGNLICFLFVGASLTERIVSSLPAQYQPGKNLMYRDVLDVVRHTWNTVLAEQVLPNVPIEIRKKLGNIIRWLTEPDPVVRGEPSARRAGTIGLDRIASHLERLALQAQIQERLQRKAS